MHLRTKQIVYPASEKRWGRGTGIFGKRNRVCKEVAASTSSGFVKIVQSAHALLAIERKALALDSHRHPFHWDVGHDAKQRFMGLSIFNLRCQLGIYSIIIRTNMAR